MKNLIFILVIIGSILKVNSQKLLSEFQIDFNREGRYILANMYAFQNKIQNHTLLLSQEQEYLQSFILSNDLKLLSHSSKVKIPNKYTNPLTFEATKEDYKILISDDKFENFGVFSTNLETGKSVFREIDFKLKKEKFIASINWNGIQLITVSNKSNKLNFYSLKNLNTPKTIYILQELFNNRDKKVYLSELIENSSFIDMGLPSNIIASSSNFKLYESPNGLSITLDNRNLNTTKIDINLNELNYTLKEFFQPNLTYDSGPSNSNSSLLDNYLLQIAMNSENLAFHIRDLNNSSAVIKSYNFNSSQKNIPFINKPLIQDGGLAYHKEIDSPKRFLKKIKKGQVAIFGHLLNNEYQISIGGVTELKTFNTTPQFGAVPISFGEKELHTTGVFDNNFNHLESEIAPNILVKASAILNNIKTPKSQVIFKNKKLDVLGYYDINSKTYKLFKI
tara:strand:- start:1465 stop:2814 length:1350 start_codon:yes stop_codon:yes gene_type:complete